MKCPNCGKQVAEGKKFCGFCGQKLPVVPPAVIPPSTKREDVHEDITKTFPVSTPTPKSEKTSKKVPRWISAAAGILVLAVAGVLIVPKLLAINEIPSSARLLFYDDFSSQNNLWEYEDTNMSDRKITNGVLTWENTTEDFLGINLLMTSANITDSYTEVSVDFSGMADYAYAFLLCRQSSTANQYYAGEFTKTDGYVSIYKQDNGEFINLAESKLGKSLGQAKIRFDCIGSELTAFVDGKKVVSVQDADFTSGKIGLGLSHSHKFPNIAVFDDFRLYVP